MNYKKVRDDLLSIPNRMTKEVDRYNKMLIKNKEDVSDLEKYILEDQLVYRTFFQVSLGQIKSFKDQFEFIEEKAYLLNDWWHVDQLMQFIHGEVDFDYAFEKAKKYVVSDLTFLRRWGYVLFLMRLDKDIDNCKQILTLIKDDDEYYVQMGAAWLLADMACNQFDLVYEFLKNSKIKYNILGKAIQKIVDSFLITNEQKDLVKELRSTLRKN